MTTEYYQDGQYGQDGSRVGHAQVENLYDAYGNAVETRYYETYQMLARTVRQFNVSESSTWYFSKLVKEEDRRFHYNCSQIYAWDEVVVTSTSFFYDEFALTDRGAVTGQAAGYGPGRITRGNLTTVKRYLASEDREIATRSYYDTVGNVVQVSDPLNHSTTTTYSPAFHYAYPTAVTNAKGQVTQTDYSFWSGLPVSVTDPNGQTTSFQYDAYNRKTRESYPDGGWKSWSYNDTYNSGAYRTAVTTERSVTASERSTVTEYRDGLGRVLRTESLEPGSSRAYVDRQYALCSCAGKTSRVSLPYRPGETVHWTETQYDGLGRVRKVIPPDGTASSNFTEYRYKVERPMVRPCSYRSYLYPVRLLVGVFDAKGIGRVQSYDPEGNLREVREDAAADFSSALITSYTLSYDTTYLIKEGLKYTPYSYRFILQGEQVRRQTIDSLGRLVGESNPENGTTTYAWDDAGRVVTKTDSREIVSATLYDEINRPTQVSFSDGTAAITYTYDLGAYGTGRLYSLTNGVATSTYTYNNVGQVIREDKTINGVPFYRTYDYNLAGQVTTARLPNGTILTNHYDSIGRLASLTSDWVDSNHPGTLASGFVYNAAGAVTQADFGNGARMTRTFNSGLQLKTLQHGAAGSPGSLLNLEYNYQETVANNGRIMGISNWNDRSKDVSYTYDRLYRLATAQTAGSHWGLSWTYDRYGNRLTQSVTKGTAPAGSLGYDAATNRVSGWTYDNAGNTLNDGRHVYSWNALNQLTGLDGGAVEYRYDAQGNRVMKISATKTTYYVFGMGEYANGVWEKLYVSLNGQKLVEYSNGTTYFFHCDHLGTARVQTSVSGAIVETWEAYPFGEQWTASGGVGNRHHYTGKERDPESNNDYFGARYYWNGAARWLSVDPVAGGVADPHQLNRYRYCRNDPINFFDPDGRDDTGAPHLHGPNDPYTGPRKPHPEDLPPDPIPLPIKFSPGNVPPPPPQTQPGWTPPAVPDIIRVWNSFFPKLDKLYVELLSGVQNSAYQKLVKGGCRDFVAGLLGKTGTGLTVDDVIGALTTAHYFDGDRSEMPSGYGGTVADLLSGSHQAAAGGGMFDPWSKPVPGHIVFIGSSFWGLTPGNRESGLIQEALHNTKWNTFTDSYLANLLTGKTYSSESEASKALTKELDAKCGN